MYSTLFEKGLLALISSSPGFEEESKILQKWDKNVLMRASDILKYKEGELNVLNHGDLWISNILFKNEKNDMRMLDFQFSCISHPVQDLYYFMMHSLNENDRIDKFEIVLEKYHDCLNKNLKMLKWDKVVPSKREFMEEMFQKIFVAEFYLVFHLMVLLLDDGTKLDMNLALEDSNKGEAYRREVLYGNSRYISAVRKFMKFLSGKNIL